MVTKATTTRRKTVYGFIAIGGPYRFHCNLGATKADFILKFPHDPSKCRFYGLDHARQWIEKMPADLRHRAADWISDAAAKKIGKVARPIECIPEAEAA